MDLFLLRDYIGLYAPVILFFLSIFLLRNIPTFLRFFVSGFILNNILNIILKLFIKEPRPNDEKKSIEIGVVNGAHIGFDKFGMPSGHAQSVFYSLTFCYWVLRSVEWFYFMIFIAGLTVFQRWKYRKHSILQLCVGGTLGSLFATLVYFVMDKYKKNGYSIYNVAK